MHYNLLFNGCSFTKGSELQGKTKDFEYRRINRFSHIISEKTNKTYANIAEGGSSNDCIVRSTIEWFEAGNTCDLAIIQLTHISRIEFISRYAARPVNFSPKRIVLSPQEMAENKKDAIDIRESNIIYYRHVYNDNLGFYNFYKNLFILEQYLEKNNIKYFFLKLTGNGKSIYPEQEENLCWGSCCKHTYLSIPSINTTILDMNNKNYCTKDYSSEGYSMLNGKHPNELGHQKIAEYLIQEIKSQNIFNAL